MYPPGVPIRLTVGRNGSLQCESFRYFGEKAAIKMAAQIRHRIMERLEGIEQGIYIAVKRGAFDKRTLLVAHKHAPFRW